MNKIGLYAFIASLIFYPLHSHANSVAAVASTKVTKGRTEISARAGFTENDDGGQQDGELLTRLHYDYGFNDTYLGRIVVSADKLRNDNTEFSDVTIENHFQILDSDTDGLDLGFRANYTHKDGDKKPSNVSFFLIQVVPFDDWEFRSNQILSHQVGEDANDGFNAEVRFQIAKDIAPHHKLGIESFNKLGNLTELSGYENQSHTVGPVLRGLITDGWAYDVGYRKGVSKNAPDHTFKFFIAQFF